jgi:hypothetical protein
MQYLLARDGEQLGQFSEEEIRSGLFEGRYQPTDSAWTDGMEDWRPLGDIMGQGVTRVSAPRPIADAASIRPPVTRSTGIAIAALVLLGVGIISTLSVGAYGNMREKKNLAQGLVTAQQLSEAVRLHHADNAGKYPSTLDELVSSGKIPRAALDQAKAFKPAGWEGEPGFEYFGAELNNGPDAGKPLLRSRCWKPGGTRILVKNDGSVELEKASSQ